MLGSSRIFISYSHRGTGPEWKARLLKALKMFEQHHLLDVWQDGKIRVSSFWNDDIQHAMSSADAAVLLLTKEALESEFILKTEFPILRDRQHRDKLPVFPVVCEECNWRGHDWLRATQAPNDSNPLAHLSVGAQDQVLRQLATDIATELSRITLAELPKSEHLLPSEHVYLDKFPLTRGPGLREEKLIGREQELALLDLAFAHPHTAIVSLVAWGGVGKTMLVQQWLQREGWFGARRVYAWSFYSQGTKEDRQASEDAFLAHALEWFAVQCEPTLSPWDKGRLLADATARERTLLILDGIEPLQYPPGPMGGQLRAPGVQSLLKQLARRAKSAKSETNCLCLVTTREPLTDLSDFQRREGSPWGNVLRVDLGNLTEEAGAALLHHTGAKRAGAAEIKPDDQELLAASNQVDGHALTLNLLGRFLARAHGGDIRRRDLVKFEEADRKEQGGTTFKMLAAFENWFSRGSQIEICSLAILRLLGLFAEPPELGWLDVLREKPPIQRLTEELFDSKFRLLGLRLFNAALPDESIRNCLSFLSDLHLISLDCAPPDFSDKTIAVNSHPLVREYFSKALYQINRSGYRALHRRMFQHFFDRRHHASEHPSLEDLRPVFMAIYHGCNAEMFVRSAVLFFQEVLGLPRAEGGNAPNQARLNIFSSQLRVSALAKLMSALDSFSDLSQELSPGQTVSTKRSGGIPSHSPLNTELVHQDVFGRFQSGIKLLLIDDMALTGYARAVATLLFGPGFEITTPSGNNAEGFQCASRVKPQFQLNSAVSPERLLTQIADVIQRLDKGSVAIGEATFGKGDFDVLCLDLRLFSGSSDGACST
jgi:hypothetical protein